MTMPGTQIAGDPDSPQGVPSPGIDLNRLTEGKVERESGRKKESERQKKKRERKKNTPQNQK